MSIISTSYDTRACRGYQNEIKTISKSLTTTLINYPAAADQSVIGLSLDLEDYFVANVRPFLHPISLEHEGKMYTFGDYRNFGSNKSGSFSAANDMEVRSLKARTMLQQLWVNDSPTVLRDFDLMPMAVYVSWLAESVSHRYGLDPKQRMQASVIAGAYYYSLFKEHVDFTDQEEQLRLAGMLGRIMMFPRNDMLNIIEGFTTAFTSLEDFVTELKSAAPIQLADFSIPLLFTLIGNTWYTTNRELLPVAIEHPPTWISVVYMASDNRAYRNTTIAKHVLRRKSNEVAQFARSVSVLFDKVIHN